MAKRKRKLTAAEKRQKRERRKKYMIIFIGGKQKRVRRPVTIDGLEVDEFIRRNADPIWLHQHEMWEYMDTSADAQERRLPVPRGNEWAKAQAGASNLANDDDEIPF